MEYTLTLKLTHDEFNEINNMIENHVNVDGGDDLVKRFSRYYVDETMVSLSLRNDNLSGEPNGVWLEAVWFNKYGGEIGYCDPGFGGDLTSDFSLKIGDDTYILKVGGVNEIDLYEDYKN